MLEHSKYLKYITEMLEHSKYLKHIYYYCAGQNLKIDFLPHVMAKLKPTQLKIAPLPVSLDVKCLWLVNKSILWKISLCSKAATQRCSWEKVFQKYAANLQKNTLANEIAILYCCSPVDLLHIFVTPFLKNTSGWLLFYVVVTFLIHHQKTNISHIMWVHQKQEDDRLHG